MKLLRTVPTRRLLGAPAFVFAVGLCIWATLARGLFDGAMLLTGMCGVFSLGLILVPSRPRLRVEVRDENPLRLELTPSWSTRPFDISAIVRQQANEALATLPEPIKPMAFQPQSDLSEAFAALGATGGIRASLASASEKERQEFEAQVHEYRRELRSWLKEVERARDEHLKVFECDLRLRELGHSAADHVHLRLRFPKGFLLARKLPRVDDPPPQRPNYLPEAHLDSFLRMNTDRLQLDDINPIRLPGTDKPKYTMEDDEVVIDYQLGRVNQSDHCDVPTFSLRVPNPGTYEVQWEASASGLGKPARGAFEIDFAQPKQGQPIDSLAEARDEQEKTVS